MQELSGALRPITEWIEKNVVACGHVRTEWILLGLVGTLALFVGILAFFQLRRRRNQETHALSLHEETAEEIKDVNRTEEVTYRIESSRLERADQEQLGGAEEVTPEAIEETEKKLLDRLRNRLSKTHDTLVGRLDWLILRRPIFDTDAYEELEEILMTADMGVKTSYELLSQLQQEVERTACSSLEILKDVLREKVYGILKTDCKLFDPTLARPFVIMVVGVNGVGKTTTIGKLAAKFGNGTRKIMLVAADTFRAAAIEQLEFWSKEVGADFVSQKPGSDPSAVAYDAIHAALSRGTDLIIVDTAGRLHTKVNLIEELKKVKRVIGRELPGAPHEIFLVLDSTTGQNAILQARTFHEALNVTGLILTKLDGTAKGGVIVGITNELKLPVRYIGIGEGIDDLAEFDPQLFLEALF